MRNYRKPILIAQLLALALSYGQPSFAQNLEINQLNDQCDQIDRKPEYSEVVAKLNDKFDGSTNPNRPTQREIEILKRYWSEVESSCYAAKIRYMQSSMHPTLTELTKSFYRDVHELRVKAVRGTLSWGEYITSFDKLRNENRKRGSQTAQEIDQNNASIAEETNRSNASAEAFYREAERQQRQLNLHESERKRREQEWERNRPRQTNCTTSIYGNNGNNGNNGNTNCTTW